VHINRIKNRELTAMVTAVIMSFALVLVAAIGLSQTDKLITQLESKSLPDIRVGLGLAEGVAQVAAFAPYVASINQPSLLEDQSSRLSGRFEQLFSITHEISDQNIQKSLTSKLNAIQMSTNQLSAVIRHNLFLQEELISQRYQLKFSTDEDNQGLLFQKELDLFVQILLHSQNPTDETISNLAKTLNISSILGQQQFKSFIHFAKKNISTTKENNRKKEFLLVSIRIQSEYLSNYVNDYVNSIQDKVFHQQQRAKVLNAQVFWGMVIMMILLIVAVFTNYGINIKVVKDLTNVTDDMVRLSIGDTRQTSRIKPRSDEIGALLNAYQVFRDYTYKIQTVSANIEQQKILLESIFDGMYDGLSVFSKNNCIMAWNKQYLTCLGLKEGDIYLGMPLVEILNLISQNGEVFKDIEGNIIEFSRWTDIRHEKDLCVERHDCSGGIIEFRSKPMGNGGFITLTQDLTYRRETELQLQQAVKMEGLGQLTGGVSHDFNNFLTSILGNLQLLEMQPNLSDNAQRYVKRALRATESGQELVKKLLAFSRKQVLDPEVICVEQLILDTQDLLEYSLDEGVSLHLNLSQEHHHIRIDKVQLQNVLLNLTINSNGAISDYGDITITTMTTEKNGQPWLKILVSDTGKGIPLAIQHRVFEAFFTTKEVGAGSGLGLSSVHGYIIQSGGEIGIESAPTAGTTIWMQWPLLHTEPILEIEPPQHLNLITPTQSMVLLVEDDEQVAQTIIDLLNQDVNQVVHFNNADKAWQWLVRNQNDLLAVLSDVHLVNSSSGVNLKHWVENDFPELPFYLYSGMAKEAIEQQFGCELDERFFLSKPISYRNIHELLLAAQQSKGTA
jgi:signal transduction histidine kinase/CheY-like chemotaxis protein